MIKCCGDQKHFGHHFFPINKTKHRASWRRVEGFILSPLVSTLVILMTKRSTKVNRHKSEFLEWVGRTTLMGG